LSLHEHLDLTAPSKGAACDGLAPGFRNNKEQFGLRIPYDHCTGAPSFRLRCHHHVFVLEWLREASVWVSTRLLSARWPTCKWKINKWQTGTASACRVSGNSWKVFSTFHFSWFPWKPGDFSTAGAALSLCNTEP